MKRFVVLFMLLMLVGQAHAVAIGVNRASVNFQDVLRNGYAREELVVTTDSEEPITGEVLIRNGDESIEWLSFSAMNFSFSRDAPFKLYVEATPPLDARIDRYRVNMSILTGELSYSGGSRLGTTTRASLGVPILLEMTGTERKSCSVGGLSVLDSERGQEIEISLSVYNTGNVRINPEVEIEVYDKFRSEKVGSQQNSFGEVVLPTRTEENRLRFALDLPRDQYWMTVSVPECLFSAVQTFDIMDTGEVKDDGDLIRLDAPAWSTVGDIIPIRAVFRNRGVRSVRANFRGTITNIHTEQIVKVINTQQYIIDPSATAEIETFFNPVEQGQYMVTGKVFYNDKLTGEKNAVLNVTGTAMSMENPWIKYTIYGLLLVAIIFLVLIIRKKKGRN